MRNESRGTTLVPRQSISLSWSDSTWSGAVRSGGPGHSETITAPNRLGLFPSSYSLMERESATTFSQEAQGRVRGRAVAEASSTRPHSLSLAARYYSPSKPFIGIRLHPKVARTFESRQGIVDPADTSRSPNWYNQYERPKRSPNLPARCEVTNAPKDARRPVSFRPAPP